MKKRLLLLLCLIATAGSAAWADIASGTFSNGGTWKITDDGELYVDVTTIPNYGEVQNAEGKYVTTAPWGNYQYHVKTIRLSSKVKTVGTSAFQGMSGVWGLFFDKRSTADIVVRNSAFRNVPISDCDFSYIAEVGDRAFEGHNLFTAPRCVELPALKKVGIDAFTNTTTFTVLPTEDWEHAFYLSGNTVPQLTYEPRYHRSAFDRLIIVPKSMKSQYANWHGNCYPAGDVAGYQNVWATYTGIHTGGVTSEHDFWIYIERDRDLRIVTEQMPDFASPSDAPWASYKNECDCIYLTNVFNSNASIGKNAFNGFKALQSVIGLEAFKAINDYAFANSLMDFMSVSNIETFGEGAFQGCTVTRGRLHLDHVKSIGKNAFSNCTNLKEIFLGPVLQRIDSKAFSGSMTNQFNNYNLYMAGEAPSTASDAFDDANYSKWTLHVPAAVANTYETSPWNKFILDKSVSYPVNGDGWTLNADGTMTITGNIYSYSGQSSQPWYNYREVIRSIMIDDGVSSIGDNAFCGLQNLVNVHIPRNCSTIGKCAFKDCPNLKNIYLIKVETIKDQAFEGCTSLQGIELGEELESVGDYVFRGCTSLTDIKNYTKEPAILTSNAFAGIGAGGASNVRAGGPRHSSSDGQQNVTLKVLDASLNDYLLASGWGDFKYANQTEHGSIVAHDRYGNKAELGHWILWSDGTLVVACDSTINTSSANYVDHNTPRDWGSNASMIKSVEVVGNAKSIEMSFQNLPNLTRASFSSSVKTLVGTFANCPKLTDIDLSGIESIGSETFKGCSSLTKADMGNVKEIGDRAFEGCTSLADVTLYGKGGKIGYYTFKDCTSLKSIDMGGINYAASGVFEGCSALESVIFRGQALQVYSNMFKNCTALKSLDVSDDCWSINASSLAGTGISRIYSASPKPPTINETAFGDRPLTSITAYVPADYMNAYRKAPMWRDMNFAIDERYGEPQLPTGGSVGEKGTWELDELGVLTIDCEGKMPASDQYFGADAANNRSWYSTFDRWAAFIENVRYTDGVTYIPQDVTDKEAEPGTYHGVKTLEIGCNVDTIRDNAMRYTGLTDVYCFAPEPPFIVTSDENGTFDKAALIANGTTLHVVDFQGTLEKYRKSYRWNWFPKIVADLPTRKPGTIMVEKVNVSSPTGTRLKVNKSDFGSTTIQLEASVYPSNADNTAVVWTSEDEVNLPVDRNGLVTVLGYPENDVNITATAADGSNRKGTVNLRIVNPENDWGSVLCEGMDVDRKTITIMKSQAPATITVKLEPANSTANIDFDVVDNSLIQVEAEYDDATGRRTGVFRISAPDPMMMPEIRTGSTQIHFYTHYYDEEKLGTEYPQVWVNVNVIEDVRFTEETVQYVPVTYAVTSLEGGTCTVYGEWVDGHDENGTWVDGGYNTAIDQSTTGLVTVPNKARNYYVTGVDGSAFADCSQLEEVEFESGIKFIGNSAFTGCSNLREVLLPETIEAFGYSCFSNLPSLKDVHILATTPPTGGGIYVGNPWPWPAVGDSYAFSGLTGATLHVPAGCKEAYNVSPWTEWFTTIQEDAVTAIDEVITSEPSVPDVWYTLDGIRISKPTKAGIYIKGGRKYIVK